MDTRTGYFITGTDTAIGKTTCAVLLIHELVRQKWRVAGMKPIASGAQRGPLGLRNDDALRLQTAANIPLAYEIVNPYCFEPPIAPHLAAQDAGVEIQIKRLCEILDTLNADKVVVEGAGGWWTPLNEQQTFADLALAFNLPVILVVGMRLGCLNHATLTYDAIIRSGIPCAGWIANHVDPEMAYPERNRDFLARHINAPLLATIPFIDNEVKLDVLWKGVS